LIGKAATVRIKTHGTPPDADLWTTEELARYLRVDPSSVRRWRTAQPVQGPPFIRLSERVVMYRREDVAAWLETLRVVPQVAA